MWKIAVWSVMLMASAAAAPSNGPSPASFTVPMSQEERHFLSDQICVDESACFGPKRFDKFIASKYPDIAKKRYLPPRNAPLDKEEVEYMQVDFRRGLYYAKLIRLANGQSLFDFLTKCSKRLSPYNWAQIAFEPKTRQPYVGMQYFPVLKQKGTGDEFEMQILLDRHGDTITARSPFFSSNVLRYSNFLDRHGLECW
ncbi:hypothetical protein [Cupriavidus sp. PET2-C1]